MPDIPAAHIHRAVEELERTARDGAYAAVGLAILALNRAQVRRHEVGRTIQSGSAELGGRLGPKVEQASDRLGAQVAAVRAQVSDLVVAVDRQVGPVRRQLAGRVDQVEQLLPEGARGAVHAARVAAREPEAILRRVVGLP